MMSKNYLLFDYKDRAISFPIQAFFLFFSLSPASHRHQRRFLAVMFAALLLWCAVYVAVDILCSLSVGDDDDGDDRFSYRLIKTNK